MRIKIRDKAQASIHQLVGKTFKVIGEVDHENGDTVSVRSFLCGGKTVLNKEEYEVVRPKQSRIRSGMKEYNQQCLKNFRHSLEQKREQLARLTAEIAKMDRDADFYQKQIDEALLMGKSSFDDERYLKHLKPI